MPDPFSESNVSPEAGRVVTVLAVCPSDQDSKCLHEIFRHSNWDVRYVKNRCEAAKALRDGRLGVVLCEALLPDGDWKDILSEVSTMPTAPPVIVTSLHADDWLWAEVLNLGGYDVLAKPFDLKEVVRITSLAWLHWKENHLPAKGCEPQHLFAARAAS